MKSSHLTSSRDIRKPGKGARHCVQRHLNASSGHGMGSKMCKCGNTIQSKQCVEWEDRKATHHTTMHTSKTGMQWTMQYLVRNIVQR